MKNEGYVRKWLDGTLTEEERKVFEQTREYESMSRISASIQAFSAPSYDPDLEFKRLKARLSPKGRVVSLPWWSPLLKIAAVITVVAGAYFLFLHNSSTVVKTLAAQQTELILPDSSYVVLSPLSKIAFQKSGWEEERKVQLEGDAYFKVAKGKKFDVETPMGKVTVLGTAFTVREHADFFEVTCLEGSVRVQYQDQIAVLSPAQMFRVIAGKVAREDFQGQELLEWKKGESAFRSVPFRYVIAEFERQYNVAVIARQVDMDRLFTGNFIHNDMELALKSITIPFNLSFQITDDKKVVLTSDLK